jgi:quinolinate synthase
LREIVSALEGLKPEVKVPEEIRERAKVAVNRMLGIPGK